MDHAAMVMVLQSLRDVHTELRTIRRQLDRLMPAAVPPAPPPRIAGPERRRVHRRAAEFPRPVENPRRR